jgi:hypothetical protein
VPGHPAPAPCCGGRVRLLALAVLPRAQVGSGNRRHVARHARSTMIGRKSSALRRGLDDKDAGKAARTAIAYVQLVYGRQLQQPGRRAARLTRWKSRRCPGRSVMRSSVASSPSIRTWSASCAARIRELGHSRACKRSAGDRATERNRAIRRQTAQHAAAGITERLRETTERNRDRSSVRARAGRPPPPYLASDARGPVCGVAATEGRRSGRASGRRRPSSGARSSAGRVGRARRPRASPSR